MDAVSGCCPFICYPVLLQRSILLGHTKLALGLLSGCAFRSCLSQVAFPTSAVDDGQLVSWGSRSSCVGSAT